MKRFGEFLVEKNMITKENLLAALVCQMKESPSIAEIVYEEKLITPEKQLSILDYQFNKNIDYLVACKDLGFWTNEIQEKINTKIKLTRKPLGEILVKKNYISIDKLTTILDQYLANTLNSKTIDRQVNNETDLEYFNDIPTQLKFKVYNNVIAEYLAYYDENKYEELKTLFNKISDMKNKEEIYSILEKIKNEGNILKNCIEYAGMPLSFYTIDLIQSFIESINTYDNLNDEKFLSKITQILQTTYTVLWRLRMFLSDMQTEQGYLDIKEIQDEFKKFIKEIKTLKNDDNFKDLYSKNREINK